MNNKKKEEKRSSEIKKQYLRAVSKDTDGKLTKDEWLNVLVQANIQNSEDEVEKMFASASDKDSRLSFEEFMGEPTRAEKLFRLMDKDGDGYVTKSEFKEVCKNLNKEQIEATFKKFDQTGNDKLSFREFRDMMTRDKGKGKGKAGKQQAVGSTDQLEAKETKGAKEAKEAKEAREIKEAKEDTKGKTLKSRKSEQLIEQPSSSTRQKQSSSEKQSSCDKQSSSDKQSQSNGDKQLCGQQAINTLRQKELKKLDEKAGAEKQPGAKRQAEKEIGRERVDP